MWPMHDGELNGFFFLAVRTWKRHSVDDGQDVKVPSTDLGKHPNLILWIRYIFLFL